MPRIGSLLVRAGALTEEGVNRALAIQGFAGGRLGTLLLERGSVSEDDVGKALAEQNTCEYIPWRTLGSVAPAIIEALPAKFAIRHSAVPVELGEGYIRVVLRDPANLRILDELFFVTGKKIVPAVAPEVRIYQALEKYYGERRTPRFAILAEKLSRPVAPSVIRKPLPPPPDFSASSGPPLPGVIRPAPAPDSEDAPLLPAWKIPDAPPVGWGGFAPPEEAGTAEPESIPWEEMPASASWSRLQNEEPRPRSAAGSAPAVPLESSSPWREASAPFRPQKPASPAQREPRMPADSEFARIVGIRGRDLIFEAALETLSRRFRRSAIFAVRPEGVVGWLGSGERVNVADLRALDIPWTEPSIFLNVRMSRAFYLGPLPPLPRHRELVAALGGWPPECLVQPVLMRDKVVAFLYAECGGAQGATPADLAYVRELAGAAAAALAASIRLKKKQVI